MTPAQTRILKEMAFALPFGECERLFAQLRDEGGYGDREQGFTPYLAATSPTGERLWVCNPEEAWLREIGYTAPEPIPPAAAPPAPEGWAWQAERWQNGRRLPPRLVPRSVYHC